MKETEFKNWYMRRYGSGDKRPYGVQKQAADDLAISMLTLRHYLCGKQPVSKRAARIVELMEENDRLRESCDKGQSGP